MQPDQAEFLLNTVYLPTLKNEHRVTKAIIAAIPADKGDFRPDPIAKTAMELAWHIAASEMRFLDAATAGEFDFSPKPRPESVVNSADLASWYAANFEERLEKLPGVSGETLAKIVDFRGMFQLPGVMYLNFMLNHSLHHRGQLSMYLRPMGAKVPAIYGDSHDSAEAKKAAQSA
jgi:uncharacterized damage-inducible protein DinB